MARPERCEGCGEVVAVRVWKAAVVIGEVVRGLVVKRLGWVRGSKSEGEEAVLEVEEEEEGRLGRLWVLGGTGLRRRGTGLTVARRIESIEAATGLRLARVRERLWRCGLLKWLAALPKV